MKIIDQSLLQLLETWRNELVQANTDQQLEALRITYLGRNGRINELMAQLKTMPLEEKRAFGPQIQELQQIITQELQALQQTFITQAFNQELNKQKDFDVTAHVPSALDKPSGSLHPYTHLIERIEDIFTSMGFAYAKGPEVETEWYNFEALNIPADHPARDMQDTFWLTTPGLLLRTHTSSVQIHTMKNQQPPLAVFTPGRVFRHEATDATHDFMFMQCEGLLIDKNISLTHLCSLLKVFMRGLFEKNDLSIRLRPSYFPFVEPGLEVDISCIFCKTGCALCKKTQWIEMGGSGLVHPATLKACGIDPAVYSGCAWGIGIERLAMLLYGINDIRLFHSGKIEFLKQF
ncbi:MAG: phenylalanine--tRNA ligase subunit alpha [Candidatus Babeliaceae bacterium]|nr:phenylalanine--tRNA ligase subunit alpha [Candidatus Babeliaceae bacterium]